MPEVTYEGLTTSEFFEYQRLKQKIFKGDMFVSFSDKELASPEHKRYDELLKKKMCYLAEKSANERLGK